MDENSREKLPLQKNQQGDSSSARTGDEPGARSAARPEQQVEPQNEQAAARPLGKDEELFAALRKKKRKKRIKRLVVTLAVILAAAAVLSAVVSNLRGRVEASMAEGRDKVLNYSADYGSISTRVSGTGTIEDVDTEYVTVPKGVEIEEVIVQPNTSLREGDVVATIDLTTVLSATAEVQEEISDLDKQLAEAGNDSVASYITAGASGRVKKIYAAKDMDVAGCMVENGALALLSLDGKMAVDVDDDHLQAGDRVTVEREDGSRIEGEVEKSVAGRATVLVTDNGPALDEKVHVLDEAGEKLGSGALYIHSPFRVTGFTGTISNVIMQENQSVYAGSSICGLINTSYRVRYNSILKERGEKEETLLELLSLYQKGALRAPFDGTVLKVDYDKDKKNDDASAQNAAPASGQGSAFGMSGMSGMGGMNGMGAYSSFAAGMGLSTGTATQTETQTSPEDGKTRVITLSPDREMKVKISVDEADILSLDRGQSAEISIESLGDRKLQGVVTNVDRTAQTSSSTGVTTYSAEITFAKEPGMLSGMSAEVVINIIGTEDVLLVPADAVQRTSASAFVYTAYDEETGEYGGEMPVETGISNDDFTEIRSGLEEGTTVYYTEKKQDDFFMMMQNANARNR